FLTLGFNRHNIFVLTLFCGFTFLELLLVVSEWINRGSRSWGTVFFPFFQGSLVFLDPFLLPSGLGHSVSWGSEASHSTLRSEFVCSGLKRNNTFGLKFQFFWDFFTSNGVRKDVTDLQETSSSALISEL